ncbi:SGNH/GDSL hydrolase family protein [Intrasporangium mesophilum]
MSTSEVFNVFHHSGSLQVACHKQSDASECWAPKTITDTSTGSSFATSGQPGLTFNQQSKRLFVYATRSDQTAGVVCVDTVGAYTSANPFCGFTALTAQGAAPLVGGISGLTNPVTVGSRWYAVNMVSGVVAGPVGTAMLCFDLDQTGPCVDQPFTIDAPAGVLANGSWPPSPTISAIGDRIIVPMRSGTDYLTCFSTDSHGACAGSWPVALDIPFFTASGGPFPLLNADGIAGGVCLPWTGAPCWSLLGEPIPSPAGLADTMPVTVGWNGSSVQIGARVYVPDAPRSQVHCYDFSALASCTNFPKSFPSLSYLYTVNADPQRPTCLWVNADTGLQIQNFDAYTGSTCGDGPIRVLASTSIVASAECRPTAYTRLRVVAPARQTYADGSVEFQDGNANPIAGLDPMPLDDSGAVSLEGLGLTTAAGLPQFLITLDRAGGNPSEVVVELTWQGSDDASCVKAGTSSGIDRYVALGDSYSSGEGNPSFMSGTDNPGKNECHRSSDAYGPRIASSLNIPTSRFTFKACSGALLADIADRIGNSGQWNEGPQLDAISAFGVPDRSVDLVTLTIGGNDIGFATGLGSCVGGFQLPHAAVECLTALNRLSAKGLLLIKQGGRINYRVNEPSDWTFCGAAKQPTCANNNSWKSVNVADLNGILGKIRDRAPNAHIVIPLYPHLFPEDPPAKCIVGQAQNRIGTTFSYTISKAAADRMNQISDDLDAALMAEVRDAKARGINVDFVETRDAFRGHSVECIDDPNATTSPWIRGLVFNDGFLAVSVSPFSFHPNVAGQRAFATAVGVRI